MRKGVLESFLNAKKATRTSHAHVVEELGREIVAGRYEVGSIMPGDAELAQRFKVSRTVLREAMKTLAAKGLVVPRARIGTRVTPKTQWNLFDGDILTWHFEAGVDEAFLNHLGEVRMAFEPHAARLAAENASGEDIEKLYKLVGDIADAGASAEALALADLRFHMGLAEVSKNPFMRTVGSLIEAALVGSFRMSAPTPSENRGAEVSATHKLIVDAIAAHNAEGAAQAMRNVINTGRERAKMLLAHSQSTARP